MSANPTSFAMNWIDAQRQDRESSQYGNIGIRALRAQYLLFQIPLYPPSFTAKSELQYQSEKLQQKNVERFTHSQEPPLLHPSKHKYKISPISESELNTKVRTATSTHELPCHSGGEISIFPQSLLHVGARTCTYYSHFIY